MTTATVPPPLSPAQVPPSPATGQGEEVLVADARAALAALADRVSASNLRRANRQGEFAHMKAECYFSFAGLDATATAGGSGALSLSRINVTIAVP